MIEWFNENENRTYPFDEDFYGVSDGGSTLPTALIADVGVSLPETHEMPGLTGLYVSDKLVSVAFGTSTSGLLVATAPLASLSDYTAVYMTSIRPDVSGFVVFGRGIRSIRGRYEFSTPLPLEYRCVRRFVGGKVTAVGKFGGNPADDLDGIVNIEVVGSLTLRKDENGRIVFGIEEGSENKFLGKCDKIAEYDRCGPPPIRSINGIPVGPSKTIIIRVKPI